MTVRRNQYGGRGWWCARGNQAPPRQPAHRPPWTPYPTKDNNNGCNLTADATHTYGHCGVEEEAGKS